MTAADKAAAAEARGDKREAAYWRAIQANVDAAPPLSPDQRDALRVLLRDGSRQKPTLQPARARRKPHLKTGQGPAPTAATEPPRALPAAA